MDTVRSRSAASPDGIDDQRSGRVVIPRFDVDNERVESGDQGLTHFALSPEELDQINVVGQRTVPLATSLLGEQLR